MAEPRARRTPQRVFRWAIVPGRTSTAHLFHRADDGGEVSRCGRWALPARAPISTVISAYAPFCPSCWGASRPGKRFPGQPATAAPASEASP